MVFQLSGPWAILINIAVWFLIHSGVSVWLSLQDPTVFRSESWLYKERAWEKKGIIYKTVFKVQKWKQFLPNGDACARNGFKKRKLQSCDFPYLQRFAQETCRAEITHWVILAFSVVFFIWNAWWIGLIMVIYSLIVNVPCIIAQRYNRIRLNKVLIDCDERSYFEPR